MSPPRIAVVTPVRDEAGNLPRLIETMVGQELRPERWTIVDTGSTDTTIEIAVEAAELHPWIKVASLPAMRRERGAPIVQAIEFVADQVGDRPPELLVNVDADVSFDSHFLRALSIAFDADPALGIAGGTCYETTDGKWRERFVTGTTVWGATRAYRWECLQDVRPLEPRLGWDGIDEVRAQARGWSTRTLRDLPFRHHRPEGARDGVWRSFAARGATAHFMGYRPSYLVLRALHHARRNPFALAMVGAYIARAIVRRPQLDDAHARRYLRQQQSLRYLGRRSREARGGVYDLEP